MAKSLSARALALKLGVSHVAVVKAHQAGRIPRNPDGTYELEAVRKAWHENTDISKPRNAITGDPKGNGSNPDTLKGHQRSIAIRAYYAALHERLEYRRESGEVVDVKDVERVAFEVARTVRDRMLAIPDRVGPVIAGISDIPLAIKTLREEIILVLEELGEGVFQRPKR